VLAALGSSQLATLEGRASRRRLIHEHYVAGLADLGGLRIADSLRVDDVARGNLPTRWLTRITLDPEVAPVDRDGLIDALEEQNIESRPVWKPMYLQSVHRNAPLFGRGDVASAAFEHGVALPSGSALTDDDIDRVIEAVRAKFST
jgi:pyridoxal phosphate-dependent aminotransferase EpsN